MPTIQTLLLPEAVRRKSLHSNDLWKGRVTEGQSETVGGIDRLPTRMAGIRPTRIEMGFQLPTGKNSSSPTVANVRATPVDSDGSVSVY